MSSPTADVLVSDYVEALDHGTEYERLVARIGELAARARAAPQLSPIASWSAASGRLEWLIDPAIGPLCGYRRVTFQITDLVTIGTTAVVVLVHINQVARNVQEDGPAPPPLFW